MRFLVLFCALFWPTRVALDYSKHVAVVSQCFLLDVLQYLLQFVLTESQQQLRLTKRVGYVVYLFKLHRSHKISILLLYLLLCLANKFNYSFLHWFFKSLVLAAKSWLVVRYYFFELFLCWYNFRAYFSFDERI